MYEAHFGLREKPFSLRPDLDFYVPTNAQRTAVAMLEYALSSQRSGMSLVTGDVGVGKTTLLRKLLRANSTDLSIGLVFHSGVSSWSELLRWILLSFEQMVDSNDPVVLVSALVEYLSGELAQGRSAVLLIDEAHVLPVELLEQLRILTNINVDKDDLLHIVLAGQSELREALGGPSTLALRQRLVADVVLGRLSFEDTLAYVAERLRVAGTEESLFESRALELIWHASGGLPRLINVLCDTGLLYACAEQKATVGAAMISGVIQEKRQGLTPIFGRSVKKAT